MPQRKHQLLARLTEQWDPQDKQQGSHMQRWQLHVTDTKNHHAAEKKRNLIETSIDNNKTFLNYQRSYWPMRLEQDAKG